MLETEDVFVELEGVRTREVWLKPGGYGRKYELGREKRAESYARLGMSWARWAGRLAERGHGETCEG